MSSFTPIDGASTPASATSARPSKEEFFSWGRARTCSRWEFAAVFALAAALLWWINSMAVHLFTIGEDFVHWGSYQGY